jgi:tight adherence protein B
MLGGPVIFLLLIFVTVFLLMQGMVVPVFGDSAKARKRLKKRLESIDRNDGEASYESLLRKKHLKQLNPLERVLEGTPAMESLAKIIEQSGNSVLAYRLVILSAILGVSGGYASWVMLRMPSVTAFAVVALAAIPYMKIRRDRANRIARFEEQLPDAIDMMKRALKAGHPFASTLKLVADDMTKPISEEFLLTFNDISYGSDVRRAMLGLLSRLPSVTVMALVTSILVQKETGGNLAEVLEGLAKVVRGRFRFQRKVKSMTAEGRMSAWVLALVPLGLFATIWVTSPSYLPVLSEDERGHNMIIYGCVSGLAGIAWIRRIINIKV